MDNNNRGEIHFHQAENTAAAEAYGGFTFTKISSV